jgi:AraC-like DNA-binding protein/mannose-6-phosphate isomerase-like protein (cupin superfamily)
MDKNSMNNDKKKIEIDRYKNCHKLNTKIPKMAEDFGLWVIDGTEGFAEKSTDISIHKDRHFEFYSLSHMFAGRGKFRLGINVVDVLPGDCILICPGDKHFYCGTTEDYYVEDSICFIGSIPDKLREQGIIKTGKYHLGLTRELLPLISQIRSSNENSWFKAAVKVQDILVKLLETNRADDPMVTLLETIRNAPNDYIWTVEELAKIRGVSKERLRKDFLRYTNMLPKNFVENFKLHQAACAMIAKNLTVTQTAHEFGYADVYHFSRRFKHVLGVAPDFYRKKNNL